MTSLSFRNRALSVLTVALLFVGLVASASAQTTTLPAGQAGVAYSYAGLTFTTPPAAGTTYSILSSGAGETGLPSGLAINASTGAISGTPQVSGTFTGRISLTSGAEVNNFPFSLTIAPALGAPAITSSLTALGAVGDEFTYLVTASNSPTSFNVGTLPAGLSYSAGTISGTPTTAGTYNVSLSANNAGGSGPGATLVITIDPSGPVPSITSAASVTADLNTAFSYQIVASNTPTSYAASGLPVGLSINTTSGAITGTPTVGGIFTSTLTASNGNGASNAFTLQFILGPVSVVNSANTLTGFTNVAITAYQLTATNTPSSFNVGALPAGLSYNATTRQITGTPTAAGNTNVTISANNSVGQGLPFTLAIQIAAPTSPSITTQPASQTKNAGESVTFTVVATGAPAPTYQWKKGTADISGATSASYTINAVTSNDAANYTVVVSNVGGTVTSNVATLTVNQSGYATWRALKFTTLEAADNAVSGPAADPDGDGVSNVVEYAFDTDPKSGAASASAPSVTATTTEWIYTYTRPADRADLTYTVQASTNLTDWTTITVTHARTATGSTETWQGRVPRATGNNVFFRLKVDLAP